MHLNQTYQEKRPAAKYGIEVSRVPNLAINRLRRSGHTETFCLLKGSRYNQTAMPRLFALLVKEASI